MAMLPTLPAGRRRSAAAMMDDLAARDRLATRLPMVGDEVHHDVRPVALERTLAGHLEQALADPERRDRRSRTEQMISDLIASMKRLNAMEG